MQFSLIAASWRFLRSCSWPQSNLRFAVVRLMRSAWRVMLPASSRFPRRDKVRPRLNSVLQIGGVEFQGRQVERNGVGQLGLLRQRVASHPKASALMGCKRMSSRKTRSASGILFARRKENPMGSVSTRLGIQARGLLEFATALAGAACAARSGPDCGAHRLSRD